MVDKNDYSALENLGRIREIYAERFPDMKLDMKDWLRFEFASTLVVGKSLADIGIGSGILVYNFAEDAQFEKVSAYDIAWHSQLMRHPDIPYRAADVRSPTSPIEVHDTVICMEVIEHIEESDLDAALSNLRSAAAERLVLTVPYNEQEPLWWHDKPGGHRQSFSIEKLARLFPKAIATIQPRHGVDWVFMMEDRQIDPPSFMLLAKPDFSKYAATRRFR